MRSLTGPRRLWIPICIACLAVILGVAPIYLQAQAPGPPDRFSTNDWLVEPDMSDGLSLQEAWDLGDDYRKEYHGLCGLTTRPRRDPSGFVIGFSVSGDDGGSIRVNASTGAILAWGGDCKLASDHSVADIGCPSFDSFADARVGRGYYSFPTRVVLGWSILVDGRRLETIEW